MVGILIANTVVLGVALVAIVTLSVLWLKAERKLAKFGQSKFFVRKEKKQ